jgi:hypothetical protein
MSGTLLAIQCCGPSALRRLQLQAGRQSDTPTPQGVAQLPLLRHCLPSVQGRQVTTCPQLLGHVPQRPAHVAEADRGRQTQLPPRHTPSAHAVPSGSVPLHLPRLRFLQGGHGFFLFFLASVVPSRSGVSAPPITAARARRREPARLRRRARVSKCVPPIVWSSRLWSAIRGSIGAVSCRVPRRDRVRGQALCCTDGGFRRR